MPILSLERSGRSAPVPTRAASTLARLRRMAKATRLGTGEGEAWAMKEAVRGSSKQFGSFMEGGGYVLKDVRSSKNKYSTNF
mmetsp:Transcript_4429/g.9969  ORF Transcript_4429/g.9969 Transcript_4429/m.9969 type:complete len:82 (-) Transcript_4429:16-261(-)